MNSTSPVSETSSSSSSRHQHPNMKEEIDADSVELTIKVEGEGEEVVAVKLEIKTEDEEKPIVCQCEECGSGGRGRVDWCTRACSSSQAIKKEEWEADDEQSGEMAVKEEVDEGSSRGRLVKVEDDADCAPVKIKREGIEAKIGGVAGCRKKAKRIEILVKEEVKEEEDEINVAGPSTQRCGSSLVDSVIIKSEDEDMTCPCEECGMIKTEEEGTGSSDNETVVEGGSEDEEDWLASNGSSLRSSSEEGEETEDGPADLMHEPNQTVSSTAPLDVRQLAGAEAEQVQTAKGRKRRPCPQCQKMVTHLADHLLTHTGQRPHICDQCGKSFNQKSNLDVHLKTHSGEKAFSCDQCGKCFTLKGQLTVHLKRHNGEKAHQCDQCPSAFVTKYQLTNHRRQHTGQRPYVCHIANCNRAFVDQSYLNKHLRFHSGDKRHQCEDCEKRFVTSSQLTSHRRHKHSTERPHRCPHSGCNYAAADKSNLCRHLSSNKHRQ